MTRRWGGGLHFDPSHESRSPILEAVVAPHARPEHVTGVQDQKLPIDQSVNLAFDEDVRLFEGMVVRVRNRGWLVVDHEHGVQLRAELLVDEHLHTDSAVGEERRRHARRHRGFAYFGTAGQPFQVHSVRVKSRRVPVSRISHVWYFRVRFNECFAGEERVAAAAVVQFGRCLHL